MQKLFILGLGAQKSGSTWLSSYMRSYNKVDLGFSKEYHIWDAINSDISPHRKVKLKNIFNNWKNIPRMRMQKNTSYYFSYFQNRLSKRNIEITGDITPCYALLESSVFRYIQDNFAARGIETKFVFLIRDPVSRCWSAYNHKVSRCRKPEQKRILMEKGFAAFFKERDTLMNTRYDLTIQKLDEATRQKDVFVGIYEELFFGNGLTHLSEFIGLNPKPEWIARKVNAREGPQVPEYLASDVAEYYRDVYEWCGARFPITRELWNGNRYL